MSHTTKFESLLDFITFISADRDSGELGTIKISKTSYGPYGGCTKWYDKGISVSYTSKSGNQYKHLITIGSSGGDSDDQKLDIRLNEALVAVKLLLLKISNVQIIESDSLELL